MEPIESEEVRQLIKKLGYEWHQLGLPTRRVTYSDFIRVLSALQSATGNMKQTSALFRGVLAQAIQLGRSSEWVEAELQFETLAEFAKDRPETLLWDLHRCLLERPTSLDELLDLYNERKGRF